MTRFSIRDAAGFGLQMVKRDPLLWAVLSVISAAIYIPYYQSYLTGYAPYLELIIAGNSVPEGEVQMQARRVYSTGLGYWQSVMMFVYFIMQCAILRLLIRGHRGGWLFGLKIGMDEVRVVLANLVVIVVSLIPFFLFMVAVFIAVFAGAMMESVLFASLSTLVFLLLGIAFHIYVGLRLSPAAAASVGRQKLVTFGAKAITKDCVWPLLAAHILVLLAGLALFIADGLVLALLIGPTLSAGGFAASDLLVLRDWLRTPAGLLFSLAHSFASMVVMAMWIGVPAYAYRRYSQA